MSYILANSNPIHHQLERFFVEKYNGIVINNRENLTKGFLEANSASYVFFPHWSYLIPEDIFTNFNCIVFHMTDLPYGRGGSPLQNLIVRGHQSTKVSAIRVEKAIDAGDIYLKRELSLLGTAEEIFLRLGKVVLEMIDTIITTSPTPIVQQGDPTFFKRRKPKDGDISALDSLESVFNHIRMLDAEGYPSSYLETEHFRFEFNRASLKKDFILADVRIIAK